MDSPVLYSYNSENFLYALETGNNQTWKDSIAKQQRPSSNFSISKNSLSTHFDTQGQGNANLNYNSTQAEQSFQYKSDKKISSSSAMVEGLAESGNNQQIPSGIAMMPIQKTTDVQQETSIVALAEAVAASLGVDSKEPTRYRTPIGLSVNHSIHADTYQCGELSKLAESGAQSLTDYSTEQHSISSGVGETLRHSTDHQTQLGCEVSGEDKSHRVNVGIKSMKCLQDKQETEDKEILSSSISYKKNKNLNSSLVLSKPLLEAPIQLYTEPYLQRNLTQGSDVVVRNKSIITRKSYGKFSQGSEKVTRKLNGLPIKKGKKYKQKAFVKMQEFRRRKNGVKNRKEFTGRSKGKVRKSGYIFRKRGRLRNVIVPHYSRLTDSGFSKNNIQQTYSDMHSYESNMSNQRKRKKSTIYKIILKIPLSIQTRDYVSYVQFHLCITYIVETLY
ncbi:uncharacterized protein LOC125058070 [Pieris napi]|uniref:uncharacterized protein LOC125058070 n=1 Tax=Pieris napi TaxID=78633 RepID=UPI001FBBD77D|nr:uncharacterized protein LOC125058070 [Pieris napi]